MSYEDAMSAIEIRKWSELELRALIREVMAEPKMETVHLFGYPFEAPDWVCTEIKRLLGITPQDPGG